jgi:hypothetical protein
MIQDAPVLLVSYVFQQAVVGRLITDDVAAQVQDWGVSQSVFDQEENVQDSAGTAVAICEWMDGFELLMLHRQSNQRIKFGTAVHEVGPVIQFGLQRCLTGRRRVNHFTAHPIFERRARGIPKIQLHTIDGAADSNRHVELICR